MRSRSRPRTLALGALALVFVFAAPRFALAQSDGGFDFDGAAPDPDNPDTGVRDVAVAPDAPPVDAGPVSPGACPSNPMAFGCASAAISYQRREGIPGEFETDTGWVPSGSPVQIRFRAALIGHTEVRAAGTLEGSWPAPITLAARGTPGAGHLETDWGILLDARIRLRLETDLGSRTWEGAVPYVPMVDFRARGARDFDPWAWEPVEVTGALRRIQLADIPLTDALVRIPGVRGGLRFDAQAEVTARYRSLQITFGGDAEPITPVMERVLGRFAAGPTAVFLPRLEGRMEHIVGVRVFPVLYVRLLGRQWDLDITELPIRVGPFTRDWRFDPARAELRLPDFQRRDVTIDFGRVTVGEEATEALPVEASMAGAGLTLRAPAEADAAPFVVDRAVTTLASGERSSVPLRFVPTEPGPVERRVTFVTSDPDTPVWGVTLRGEGLARLTPPRPDAAAPEASVGDAGPGDAGGEGGFGAGGTQPGCGCRVGAAAPARGVVAPGALGAALAALALGRRARRRRGER